MTTIGKKIIGLAFMIMLLLIASPSITNAQLNNTLPDPSSPGGTPSNGGIGSSGTNPTGGAASIDPGSSVQSGPGGPGDTDPPPQDAPIDGGITILLAIGLVNGYLVSRKANKKQCTV